MLTVKKIEGLRPQAKKYKAFDIEGLYLEVLPTGTKSWRYNYKHDNKNLTKTYGNYPAISLAEARKINSDFKDTIGTEQVSTKSHTFDDLRDTWLRHKLPTLKNKKHQQQLQYRMDEFCKSLEGKDISTLKRSDFVQLVMKVQDGGIIETAHRVGMHLRQMFDYAVDLGWIDSHPATGLARILKTPETSNMMCVPLPAVPKLLKDIDGFEYEVTRLALMFMANTFVRTGEARFMEWSEVKWKDRIWLIPGSRMKMGLPHVVPLSDQSIAILRQLENINGDFTHVFQSPNKRGQPMSENMMLDGLYSLGYRHKMTVHGFRSLASTVLNQESQYKGEVIERQLAHKEKDEVRAAYNRAEYLDERIKMMQWYSDWLTRQLASAHDPEQ